MTETPWRAWLAAALAVGLTPHEFWRVSLAEWRALMAPPGPEPFNRAAFDALAARFPDRSHG